jgi:hypothetical protein
MSRRFRIGTALVLVILLALMLTGCQAIVENAAKGALEGATGVKVDTSGDSLTVTGQDGGTTTVGGKSLPEGMPSDFPVYEGTIITSGKMATAEGSNFSFSMETPDGVQTVSDWYKAEFEKAGWTVDKTFVGGDAGSETSMMVAKKGTSEANVTGGGQEGKTTIISVLTVK